MSTLSQDVYGGNYQKAKGVAFARSGGKCQFCGLRKARDAHHWAYPGRYPSGRQVQGHDLTALCKPCHELASMVRDWVVDKGADMNDLAEDFRFCNTYIAKREVFSYWLYPEDDQKSVVKEETFDDQIHGLQAQISHHQYARGAIERQIERIENGESLDTSSAWDDAKWIESDLTLEGLNEEYKFLGQEIRDAINKRERLRKQKGIGKGCSLVFTLCLAGIILYVIYLAVALPK